MKQEKPSNTSAKNTRETEKDFDFIIEPVFRQAGFKAEIKRVVELRKADGWIKVEHANELYASGANIVAHLKFYRYV